MEEGNVLGMATYAVLMTSIFVNVFIISFVGDKVKEQVRYRDDKKGSDFVSLYKYYNVFF